MIESLIQSASYLPNLNTDRLKSAFEFAQRAHDGQLRKDGTPYITHPLAAAHLLTGLRVDEDTLIAALLHDVPEDTAHSLEEIEESFGMDVRFLVEGITKLSKVYYRNNMEERQVESLKKLLLHSAKDPRVILIKLADRLHNMSTLEAIPDPLKRARIARETLEIYVPIANLLGIWDLKSQLEDYCFKALNPDAYEKIRQQAFSSYSEDSVLMKETVEKITDLLKKNRVPVRNVEARRKTYFSTFQKMIRKQKVLDEIHDFIGIRIIVDDIGTCYQALGVVHQNFTPKLGRLKDYIAIPKSNGYQSIHTTVFGIRGIPTEIQIRSYEMHLEDEYGIAAHYFYSNPNRLEVGPQRRIKKRDWVDRILELQRQGENNERFMKDLRVDVFEDRIFCFTPKGDVIDLPKGATALDFAFHVHTSIGESAIAARINGKKMDLATELKNGDVVYVDTDLHSEGPQVKWIHQVKTNMAKHRIKDYLKAKDREALLEGAESLLLSTLSFFGLTENDLDESTQEMLTGEFKRPNWSQFLIDLGEGSIDLGDVVKLLDERFSLLGAEYEATPALIESKDAEELKSKKFRHIGLRIVAKDHLGLLGHISQILSALDINIIDFHATPTAKSDMEMVLHLEIHNSSQFEKAIQNLGSLSPVKLVERID